MSDVLDLSKRHFVFNRGEITAIGTWVRMGDRMVPCLVLVRRGEEKSDKTVPCIITADNAWIWSEDIGDPGKAAQMSFQYAEALRLDTSNVRNVFKITTLVHDLLGELLHIPPYKAENTQVTAEITVTAPDGKTREVAVSEDV